MDIEQSLLTATDAGLEIRFLSWGHGRLTVQVGERLANGDLAAMGALTIPDHASSIGEALDRCIKASQQILAIKAQLKPTSLSEIWIFSGGDTWSAENYGH